MKYSIIITALLVIVGCVSAKSQDTIVIKTVINLKDTIPVMYLYSDTAEVDEDGVNNVIEGYAYKARAMWWTRWEFGFMVYKLNDKWPAEGDRVVIEYLGRHKLPLKPNIIVWQHRKLKWNKNNEILRIN